MSSPSSSSCLILHIEHIFYREIFTLENYDPSLGVEHESSPSVVRSSSTALAGPIWDLYFLHIIEIVKKIKKLE
jgi:hypothetical protein